MSDMKNGFEGSPHLTRKSPENTDSPVGGFREKIRKYVAGPIAGMAIALAPHADAISQEVESEISLSQADKERETADDKAVVDDVVARKAARMNLQDGDGKDSDAVLSEEEQQRVFLEKRGNQRYIEEFDRRAFSSEQELIEFVRIAAREQKNEFFLLFSVAKDGKIEILQRKFDKCSSVNMQEEIAAVKNMHGYRLRFVHTHPKKAIECFPLEEGSGEKGYFEIAAPSHTDISAAHHQLTKKIWDGWNEIEYVVVSSDAVWRYSTNEQYEVFLKNQQEDVIQELVYKIKNSHEMFLFILEKLRGKKITKEGVVQVAESGIKKIRDFFKVTTEYPHDEIIMSRLANDIFDSQEEFELLVSRENLRNFWSGWSYENKEEKFQMENGIGGKTGTERVMAIERYIEWCKERGINMTYTPFREMKDMQ